ncbi:nuclear pore complex protein NUP88-like isoform X1 [Populus nigra]|uniref:nuclear pore complex protein NUP88-like isoform X1 n=1 Tax=Populus nigra TaxID=3691 RepID=UPI002B273C40|nr:nuclear pore complex protein NUP88-like isoform X1 [Populus nigra]
MRFNFDLTESNPNSSSRKSLTPKEDTQWVPLQNHPLFASSYEDTAPRSPSNLLAWDGASRFYYWDSNLRCLHRISIRLGDPEPSSVLAASLSKVLQTDAEINFEVNKISINRNGSAMVLSGTNGLCVMYLYGRSFGKDNAIVCRTVSIGSQIYFNESNAIETRRVSWHPYSDTHLGILSSDSVFRLFDLSSDVLKPEQEYYLQPVEPGRSRNAASICPVDFSFGGYHLWDRFSVFLLFSDGSVYILCPIVPFGSVHKWESVLEIYSDAETFGLKSANPVAVNNSNRAISWLEATFPELAHESKEGGLSTLKAHPYAVFDASLCLQGPLRKVHHGGEDEDPAVSVAECEGRAISFLYDLASKDSILVTAWSGGQMQIDALADEIQPVWMVGSPPRLRVNSQDHIIGLAMLCESISGELPVAKLDQPHDNTVWLGHPPPLLRLAIVDLALPRKTESGSYISMFVDPVMPERIYSVHDGGIDSIVLHFLPFTSQSGGKDEMVRTPSVHPVLSTCQVENSTPSPLCGFIALSDSFGYSWIAVITSNQECVVLEMRTLNLLLPVHVDMEKKSETAEEWTNRNPPDIISKELLIGPKVVLVPQGSPNLRSVAADSIEGRSTLHQYLNLFHENYVEYAHKVYFELEHHGPRLKRIIDDQHARLGEAQEKLSKVRKKQSGLEDRINNAMHQHNLLEQRLHCLKNLPGAHKKPLSKAEREFKSELDHFTGVELDALRTSIDTLRARLRRFTQSSKGDVANQQMKIGGRNYALDAQISQLKSSIAKLSLLNSENTKKVKLVESVLKNQESSR